MSYSWPVVVTMKIFKIARPLPLGEIGIKPGGRTVDRNLSEAEANFLSNKFDLVKSIGEGMWGIAYLTSDDKVLKITTDIQEMEAAKMLMNFAPHEPFVKVYETGKVEGNLYYILREKVTPLSEDEMILFENTIDDYYENPDDFITKNLTPAEFEKVEQFTDYKSDIVNYGFDDVFSPFNVGYNSHGNLVCFDPSSV